MKLILKSVLNMKPNKRLNLLKRLVLMSTKNEVKSKILEHPNKQSSEIVCDLFSVMPELFYTNMNVELRISENKELEEDANRLILDTKFLCIGLVKDLYYRIVLLWIVVCLIAVILLL